MALQEQRILVVDDDHDILTAARLLLKKHVGEVVTTHDPSNIPQLMSAHAIDLVLLDMNFSPGENNGAQGFSYLEQILRLDSDAVVVMITAHGDVHTAVEAMKRGATDFISKPWQNEKILATLSAAAQLRKSRCETQQLKRSNRELVAATGEKSQTLLGKSEAMESVNSLIRRTAPTDANVLIIGENGTGKELVARELHRQSTRADQVFMSVDLGAVSETLFESELFGHTKGAFTGATSSRVGRLVAASGGTLFLDEISNIPTTLQAKLLTVLEQRRVTPVGSNQSIDIDVRVIAATNISRRALSDEQQFRQDLLFRLNTVEIIVPALRQRAEDIEEIAAHYLQHYSRKYRKPEKQFSPDSLKAARQSRWPGNVRALRHAIERAVILSESALIEPQDLQLSSTNEGEHPANSEQGLNEANAPAVADLNLENAEKRLVKEALHRHGFNISKAAKELGLTRASLYRRMEKHDL